VAINEVRIDIEMVYINRKRPHDSEARRRREDSDFADRLEMRRGQFIRWMKTVGLSSEEMERELAQMDRIIESKREAAEYGMVD
jgi:CRISPR/Cas system-associated protein Cas5 (RAMP superfamily)